MMGRKGSELSMAIQWAAVAMLFVQTMAISVVSEASFEDEKNFLFFPSPGPPPAVLSSPPAPSSHGGHATPTPSHGGGGDGGYSPPPVNCGKPPSQGHHHPTPSSPSGGGYYHSPPSSTPTTPTVVIPPTTPITAPPTAPSPPFPLGPNSPPFTCIYWRNHPTLVWRLLGWWGTVATSFGTPSLPGGRMNLLQALSNTRADSIGDLYREGSAALLNSMVHGSKFPYTTAHVRDSFVAALSSKTAAAAQAQLFRLANEGRIKIRV